jgi:hypothetical protein
VFTLADTLQNTFGNFRTVFNTNGATAIDTLSIMLTNAAEACCVNPMGLDTIVFASTPSSPPPTFSLSGQVTDSATGMGISGALVSVDEGSNVGRHANSDDSGNYSITDLKEAVLAMAVSAQAVNYVGQTKHLTLTSNDTLSFQLMRRGAPPAPPPAGATTIGFNGLTANGASVSTYTESGFTVSATSGSWVASTTYGNPPPFIQFNASAGSTVAGGVRITAGGSSFSFYSIDLYSSTTPIPYTITGLRNSSTTFTLADTLPNTFGAFRTVLNPNAAAVIDTLSVVLTNGAAACCANPMGLDNVVFTR